ncbi:MAG: hypothetical protein ACYTGC_19035 [Planctomycetota bacterium]|jgi:hypothetical protein
MNPFRGSPVVLAIRSMTALASVFRAVLGLAGWTVGLVCLLLAMSAWLAEAGASMFR